MLEKMHHIFFDKNPISNLTNHEDLEDFIPVYPKC